MNYILDRKEIPHLNVVLSYFHMVLLLNTVIFDGRYLNDGDYFREMDGMDNLNIF